MQRPFSIIWFERLAYLSLALFAVSSYIAYADMRAAPRDPSRGGPGIIPGILLVTLAVYIPLIRYATRRANNLARWLLAGLLAFSLLAVLNIREILDYGGPSMVIAIVQFFISTILIWLLFRPDARQWFAGHRPLDPDIFR